MRFLSLFAVALSSLLLLDPSSAQGSYVSYGQGCPGSGQSNTSPGVILPMSMRTQMGGRGNYFGVGRADQIYQQVFLGSEAPKPLVVLGYGLRQIHSTPGGTQTYKITLGYTKYNHSNITSTFASNWNARGPGAVMFQGKVVLPQLPGNNSNVNRFALQVRFSRPWVYTPKAGDNILWQLENTSAASSVNGYDAVSGSTTTRVYASPVTSTSGTVGRNYGLAFKLLTPNTSAVPLLSNTGLPSINATFTIGLSQAKPNTAAGLITGFSQTKYGAFQLPLDLTPFGAPGCNLLTSFDIMIPAAVDGSGAASSKFAIPNDTKLRGLIFYNQYFVLDAAINALGLVWSNAAKATIG